jgi:TIR domain
VGHVFVSYSRTDAECAQRLRQHLVAAGLEVWIDDKIQTGDLGIKSSSHGSRLVLHWCL